jgi:hypothetical protein
VITADYKWPWTRRELGPRLFVVAGGAVAQRAADAGLDVVMNRCPAVEWALRR